MEILGKSGSLESLLSEVLPVPLGASRVEGERTVSETHCLILTVQVLTEARQNLHSWTPDPQAGASIKRLAGCLRSQKCSWYRMVVAWGWQARGMGS